MVRVRVPCKQCGGLGILSPLGEAGDKGDVKRFFPRPCDACNCSRYVYINTEIEEKKDEGTSTSGYVAG